MRLYWEDDKTSLRTTKGLRAYTTTQRKKSKEGKFTFEEELGGGRCNAFRDKVCELIQNPCRRTALVVNFELWLAVQRNTTTTVLPGGRRSPSFFF